MQRVVLRSKIHRATVTSAHLDYDGSCALGPELLAAADIAPGEQLHVVNVTNGSRAVTYAIQGSANEVGLNGAMAHLGSPGDVVILMTYAVVGSEEVAGFEPIVVSVDKRNHPAPAAVAT